MDQQAENSEPEDGEILDENEESSPEGEYEHRRPNFNKRRSNRRYLRGSPGRSRAEQHRFSRSEGHRRPQGSSGANAKHRQHVSYSRSRSGGGSHAYPHYAGHSKNSSRSRRSPSSSMRASASGSVKFKQSTKKRSSSTRACRNRTSGKRTRKNGQDHNSSRKHKHKHTRIRKKSQHNYTTEWAYSGSMAHASNKNMGELSRISIREDHGDSSITVDAPLSLNGSAAQNGFCEAKVNLPHSNVDNTEPVSDDDDSSVQVIPEEEIAAMRKSPLIITLDTTDTSDEEGQNSGRKRRQSTTEKVENDCYGMEQLQASTGEEIIQTEDNQQFVSVNTDVEIPCSSAAITTQHEAVSSLQRVPSNQGTHNQPADEDPNGENSEIDEEIYVLELRKKLLADLSEKTVKQELANASRPAFPNNEARNVAEIQTAAGEEHAGGSMMVVDEGMDEEENALREVLLSQMANKKRKMLGKKDNDASTVDRESAAVPAFTPNQSSSHAMVSPGPSNRIHDVALLGTQEISHSAFVNHSLNTGRHSIASTPVTHRDSSISSRGRRGRKKRQQRTRNLSGGLTLHTSQISHTSIHHRMVRLGNEPFRNLHHVINRPANIRNLPDNDLRNKLVRIRRNEQKQQQQQMEEPNISSLTTLFPDFGVADTDMRKETGGRNLESGSDMTIRRTVNFSSNQATSATASSSNAITYMAPINVDIPSDQASLQLQSPHHSMLQNDQTRHLSPYNQHISPLCRTPLQQSPGIAIERRALLEPPVNYTMETTAVGLTSQSCVGILNQQQEYPFHTVYPFEYSSQLISAPPTYASSGYPFLPNTSLHSSPGLIMSVDYNRHSESVAPLDVDHRVNQPREMQMFYSGNNQDVHNTMTSASNVFREGNISSAQLGGYSTYSAETTGIAPQGPNSAPSVLMFAENQSIVAVTTVEQSFMESSVDHSTLAALTSNSSHPATTNYQYSQTAVTQYIEYDRATGRELRIGVVTRSRAHSLVSVARSSANVEVSVSGGPRPICSTTEHKKKSLSKEGNCMEKDKKILPDKSSNKPKRKEADSVKNIGNVVNEIGGANEPTSADPSKASSTSTNSQPIPKSCGKEAQLTSSVTSASAQVQITNPPPSNEPGLPSTSSGNAAALQENNSGGSLIIGEPEASSPTSTIPSSTASLSTGSSVVSVTVPESSTSLVISSSGLGLISSLSSGQITASTAKPTTSSAVFLPGNNEAEPSASSSSFFNTIQSTPGAESSSTELPVTTSAVGYAEYVQVTSSSIVTGNNENFPISPPAGLSAPVDSEHISVTSSSSVSSSSSPQERLRQRQGLNSNDSRITRSRAASGPSITVPPPRFSPAGRDLKVRHSPLLELCSVTPLRESTSSPVPDSTTVVLKETNKTDDRHTGSRHGGGKSNASKSSNLSVPSKQSNHQAQVPIPPKKSIQKVQSSVPLNEPPKEKAAVPPKRLPQKEQIQNSSKRLPQKDHFSLLPRSLPKTQIQIPAVSKPGMIGRKSMGQSKAVVPIVVPVADGDTTDDDEDEEGRKREKGRKTDKDGDNGNKQKDGDTITDRNDPIMLQQVLSSASDPSSPAFQTFLDEFLKNIRKNVDKLEMEKTLGNKKAPADADSRSHEIANKDKNTEASSVNLLTTAVVEHIGLKNSSISSQNETTEAASTSKVAGTIHAPIKGSEDKTIQKSTGEKVASPSKTGKATLAAVSREPNSDKSTTQQNVEAQSANSRKRQASPLTHSATPAAKKIHSGESLSTSQGSSALLQRSSASTSSMATTISPMSKAPTNSSSSLASSSTSDILLNSKAVIESLTQRVTETRDQIQLSFKEKELLQSRQMCYDEYKGILRDLQQHTRLANFDIKLGLEIDDLEKKLAGLKKKRETAHLKALDLNMTIRDKSKAALARKQACLTLAGEVKKLGDRVIGGKKYKVPDIFVENINELIRSMKTMDTKQTPNLQRERGVSFKQLILEEGTFSTTAKGSTTVQNVGATHPQLITTGASTSSGVPSNISTPSLIQQHKKPIPSSQEVKINNSKATTLRSNSTVPVKLAVLSNVVGKNVQGQKQSEKTVSSDSNTDEQMPPFITKAVSDVLKNRKEGKQEEKARVASEERLPLSEGDILSAVITINVELLDNDVQGNRSLLQTNTASGHSNM